MKITPAGAPSASPQNASQGMAAATERALNAYKNASAAQSAQTEQPIVQNQNAISPEEASVVTNFQKKAVEQESQQVSEEPAQETQQTETTTAAVEEQESKAPVDTPESRRFAQLARQEKALRIKAQEVKAQEQALQQRQAELDAREQSYKQPQIDTTKYVSRDSFKLDPIAALQDLGLSYEELTNAYINHTPQDPRVAATISELKAELQALRQASEDAKKQSAESQAQQYQAAINKLKVDTKKLVDSDPNYETIKSTKSHDDVVDLIEQTYKKDGIVLSVEEAAQMVEDYLVEEALQLTKINKIKAKLALNSAPKEQAKPAPKPQAETQPKQPQMKTLTNNTASTRQLSSKERAILAFKGQLK